MTEEQMTDPRRDPFVPGPPAIAVATRPTDPPIVRPLAPPEARRLVLVAGAVGLLGQLLFVAQGAGINVPIWTAAVLVAAGLARSRETAFDRLDAWLPVAALLFAGSVAVRADPDLVAFDLVAAFGLTSASIAALRDRHGEHDQLTLAERELAGVALSEVGDAHPLHGRLHRDQIRWTWPQQRVLMGQSTEGHHVAHTGREGQLDLAGHDRHAAG
jgi:hypothetical protein